MKVFLKNLEKSFELRWSFKRFWKVKRFEKKKKVCSFFFFEKRKKEKKQKKKNSTFYTFSNLTHRPIRIIITNTLKDPNIQTACFRPILSDFFFSDSFLLLSIPFSFSFLFLNSTDFILSTNQSILSTHSSPILGTCKSKNPTHSFFFFFSFFD